MNSKFRHENLQSINSILTHGVFVHFMQIFGTAFTDQEVLTWHKNGGRFFITKQFSKCISESGRHHVVEHRIDGTIDENQSFGEKYECIVIEFGGGFREGVIRNHGTIWQPTNGKNYDDDEQHLDHLHLSLRGGTLSAVDEEFPGCGHVGGGESYLGVHGTAF